MKKFRRILALLLASVMVLSMSIAAFADETPATHKITNSSETHTYEVYQIFTGKYDATTEQLQGLRYGANAVGAAGAAVTDQDLAKLAAYVDAGETQVLDQKDIAFISQFVNLEGDPFTTIAPGADVEVAEGYYLIKDVDGSQSGKEDEQYTLYLIDVLNEDIIIEPKTGTVTSEKKLDDINDSTGAAENLQDSADYDIGDKVPFHLKGTIAENVGAYKKYHFTFEDTLEAGCFDAISTLTIKVDGKAAADTDDYKVTIEELTAPSESGFKVKITFEPKTDKDLSALAGKDVTIDFTATLGEGANIGQEGNVNTLQLYYSNNPNSTDDSEEGKTPEDTVIVFTYDLVVNKVDEDGNVLNGASFALYKEYTEEQLEATSKTAETEIKYDDNKKTYAIGDKKYVKIGEQAGASTNIFTFSGVDDGNYLLVETKVPAGYNCLDPKTFSITGTHTAEADINKETKKDANGNYILTAVDGTGEITLAQHKKADGTIDGLTTDIENKSGATLPSTGGIGTTLFYIVGAILVIGAGVILISRRRMDAQ